MRANLLKRDVFVLEVYGVIASTISLQGDRLHTLFVATKYTRRGLGKLLVKHVENLAIQRGVKALVLSSSRTALPFYEKLGFTKRNFEPREFAPTWAMEKQL